MKKATPSFRHYAELLDDIIYHSEFRAEKDMQYPDDERNARTAEGLTEMAAWFKRQDNDSPLMVRSRSRGTLLRLVIGRARVHSRPTPPSFRPQAWKDSGQAEDFPPRARSIRLSCAREVTLASLGLKGQAMFKTFSFFKAPTDNRNFHNEGILLVEWSRRLAPWSDVKLMLGVRDQP